MGTILIEVIAQGDQKGTFGLNFREHGEACDRECRQQDAKDKVTATALDGVAYVGAKVQQRPIAVTAAVGALGLFMARRPITALLRRLYVRFHDRHRQFGD